MLYANYAREKLHNLTLIKEAGGYPFVLLKSKGKNLKDYKIYGNSIQNGEPSPETPVEIQSVGERTKNLIPTPYFTGIKTINGITFTDNGDGSITVNGTATKGAYFMDYIQLPTLKAGQKYRLSCLNGSYAVDGSNQYQLFISDTDIGFSAYAINSGTTLSFEQDTNLSLDFVVYEGVTVNNLILKPQLEEGATTTSYEPYGYKIPITVSGKNLFDGVFEYGIINGTTGINGSYNENYIRGKNYIEVKPNTKYKISVDDANIKSMFVYEYNENKEYVLTTNKTIALSDFLTTNSDTKHIKFRPSASAGQLTPTSIKVQIEEGTVATSYEPYVEPVTTNIYLDEPLRKIGDYADYIDFKKQKVFRNVEVVDNTGALTIEESLKGIVDDKGTKLQLPNIPTHKGITIIETDTNVAPSDIWAKYISK